MLGWVETLVERGHSVEVISIIKGAVENYSILKPEIIKLSDISKYIINIFGPGGANLFRGFPSVTYYYRLLKKNKYDLIIIRDFGRWFSFITNCISRILGTPLVVYSQTPLYSERSLIRHIQFEVIFYIFNCIWITPLSGYKNNSIKIPSKMYFIPFVVPISNFKSRKKNSSIELFSIGKYTPRKNFLLLIKSIKQLIDCGYDIHLTIVGENSTEDHDNYYKSLEKEIVINSLENRVALIQNIPNELISQYYLDADCFILPATREPASISVVEALAHGIPVVCSSQCGTKYYIESNSDGFVFKDNSVNDLTYNIKKIINNINHPKTNRAGPKQIKNYKKQYITELSKVLYMHFGLKI